MPCVIALLSALQHYDVACFVSSYMQKHQRSPSSFRACPVCMQPQGTPRGTVTSMCNSDIPSQAVYARFLMVVSEAHVHPSGLGHTLSSDGFRLSLPDHVSPSLA